MNPTFLNVVTIILFVNTAKTSINALDSAQYVIRILKHLSSQQKHCFVNIRSSSILTAFSIKEFHSEWDFPIILTHAFFMIPSVLIERGVFYEQHRDRRVSTQTQFIRHYIQCEAVVIFQEEVPENFAEFLSFGDVDNKHPFFFIGLDYRSLEEFMRSKTLFKLKWKMGIALNTDNVITNGYTDSNTKLVTVHKDDVAPNFGLDSKLEGSHFDNVAISIEEYVAWFKQKKPLGGIFYNLMQVACAYYNFTYDIELNKGGIIPLKNGSWGTGAIAAVMNDKDMIVGMALTGERMHVMDYTSLFGIVSVTFFSSFPKNEVPIEAVIYPFQPSVWISLLIGIILFIPGFYIGLNFYSLRVVSVEIIYESLLIPYGAMLEQGCHLPRNHRVKFLYTLALFYSIVLGTGYKSNLVSHLTFPEPEEVAKSFDELVMEKNKDYTIYYMSFNDAGIHYFRTSKSKTFVAVGERMIVTQDRFNCLKEALLHRRTVCIGWSGTVWTVVKRNLTLNRLVPLARVSQQPVFRTPVCLSFGKGYKFYDEFNAIVYRLRDTGHYPKWFEDLHDYEITLGIRWLNRNRNTDLYKRLEEASKIEEPVKPFKLNNVVVTFYIMLCGIMVSACAFTAEVCTNLNCLKSVWNRIKAIGVILISIYLTRMGRKPLTLNSNGINLHVIKVSS
ncbi:unnamed protein product [Allacma fusca]|uniref:Ionotropic glutamate receptor C-terminal domain-containing protein n=1 Tax=Allacma fusca TaxID=39272 RepID=A0A8J2KVW9_9HEXA|nr:unnamed protein product [Allacma fusca]